MKEADAALIIDPEDVDQMQAAIELVMDEPEAAADRALAGRHWVEKYFIRDVLARRMATFLERVLADSKGQPERGDPPPQ